MTSQWKSLLGNHFSDVISCKSMKNCSIEKIVSILFNTNENCLSWIIPSNVGSKIMKWEYWVVLIYSTASKSQNFHNGFSTWLNYAWFDHKYVCSYWWFDHEKSNHIIGILHLGGGGLHYPLFCSILKKKNPQGPFEVWYRFIENSVAVFSYDSK